MSRTGKKLSELVDHVRRYHHSGEINLEVNNAPAIITAVREKFHDATISDLDGVKIIYPTWWFSLRSSNTEPLLRLNLEADSEELMQEKEEEILALIKQLSQ